MAKQTKEQRLSFADALAAAGEDDLAELREQITSAETELAAIVAKHRNKIDGLKAAAAIIDRKLHGKPARAPRGSGGKKAATNDARDSIRTAIHDLISKEGSMTTPAIAARLGKSNIQIAMIVRHCDWFKTANGEVHIA